MSTILLATDGSPSAEQATANAVELALATGRPLRVVTVWHVPVPMGFGSGYATVGLPVELISAERSHATGVAETAVARARAAGVDASLEVREGDPADEICTAARACGAGVIVIGAHGWRGIKRVLFGSISTRVLHEAPCPVLVVRGVSDDERVSEQPPQHEHAAV